MSLLKRTQPFTYKIATNYFLNNKKLNREVNCEFNREYLY